MGLCGEDSKPHSWQPFLLPRLLLNPLSLHKHTSADLPALGGGRHRLFQREEKHGAENVEDLSNARWSARASEQDQGTSEESECQHEKDSAPLAQPERRCSAIRANLKAGVLRFFSFSN